MAGVPFTVTASTENDRTECMVCAVDFMEQTDPAAKIWQCSEGHTMCAQCFDAGGRAEAPCSECDAPMGSIRNRALEKLRNAHLQRVQARAAAAQPNDHFSFKFFPSTTNPLGSFEAGSESDRLATASGKSLFEPAACAVAAVTAVKSVGNTDAN